MTNMDVSAKFVTNFILWIFFLYFTLHIVESCSSSRKCSYTTCSTTWDPYHPSPPHGGCVYQISKARHHYRSHTKSGSCSNRPCTGKDIGRYLCKVWTSLVQVLQYLSPANLQITIKSELELLFDNRKSL